MNKKVDCSKLKRAYMIPVAIHDGTPFIMVMRPSNKQFGGIMYQIAKGRIDAGETSKQAAIRECSEELGINISTEIESLGYYFNNTSEVFFSIVKNCEQDHAPCFETIHTAWLTIPEFLSIGRDIQKMIITDLRNRLTSIIDV